MSEFDTVVVGSGPTAIAALHGLTNRRRIVVVTGAVPSISAPEQLHPKIQSVATETGQVAGVADALATDGPPTARLFASAAVGGFANYWGQQFTRYACNDPWPRNIFASHAAYEVECRAVESLFSFEGGELLTRHFEERSPWHGCVPRLMTGTPDKPGCGLAAMSNGFRALIGSDVPTITARATHLARTSRGWRVALQDGQSLSAERIILAAGVLGTSQLILRSWPDLDRARFRDHSPWMAYVVGLRALLAERPAIAAKHLNALTLERMESERSTLFASVYDLRQAEFNLLLASILKRTSKLLRGWRTPLGAGLVQPLQIWTSSTEDVIEIDAASRTASAVRLTQRRTACDPHLADLRTQLRRFGAKVLKIGTTRPGFGFHYHALELSSKGGAFIRVDELLRERTGGGVLCVDASVLQSIGCRPHTLTAMAAARGLARRHFASQSSG